MCISVASVPSNFGTTIHNAAFRSLGLNFIYKAFAVSDISGAITGVRALGIRGCSVSMPFKNSVISCLDAVEHDAASIGAVNTVVNENGILTGYNTDVYGARKALEGLGDLPSKSVMVLGAGGAAIAVIHALKNMNVGQVTIVNRTQQKADTLAQKMGYRSAPWDERAQVDAEVLINATSVGMQPNPEQCPVEDQTIGNCSVVMDLVIVPIESRLVQKAKNMGKTIVPGYKMSLFQAAMQFKLYTGAEPPLEVMETAMADLLRGSV